MFTYILRFVKQDEGATAPEYGLMVALIAAFIIGSVTLLGTNIAGVFTAVAGAIGGVS